jgi:hypothetical protein
MVSEKFIEDDLSQLRRVQASPHINWVLVLRGVRIRVRRVLPSSFPASPTTKRRKTIKSTKAHYPSNPKLSFNPMREVRKESPKPKEEAFVCMFCGRAGHLDEFCFRRKRIEKRRFDYARNSYHDEFIDFSPHSYSRVPPCPSSHASPPTSSHALSHFSHGPNHRSSGFGSCENSFVPRRFGYGPHPHHGDHFPCRPDFPT